MELDKVLIRSFSPFRMADRLHQTAHKNLATSIPNARKLNITEAIWQQLSWSINQLVSRLKESHPDARLEKIIVLDCSLTRGLMMAGSDIDEMYLGVSGITNQGELEQLTAQFAATLKVDGLNIKKANALPLVVNANVLSQKEQRQILAGKNVITLFLDGQWKSRAEIMAESRFPKIGQVDKYLGRLRLLLLTGEYELAAAQRLLSNTQIAAPDAVYLDEMATIISTAQQLSLSREEHDLVLELNSIMDNDPLCILSIQAEKAAFVEATIQKLVQKKLVVVFNDRLILSWRVHSPRWSDAFWKNQITLVVEGQAPKRSERTSKPPGDILQALGDCSLFVSAAALDTLRGNMEAWRDWLITTLRTYLMKQRAEPQLIYSQQSSICHYLLGLMPEAVKHDCRMAGEVADLIFKEVRVETMPEFLIFTAIEVLGKIAPNLSDYQTLLSYLQQAEQHPDEWVRAVAVKTQKTVKALSNYHTLALEEIRPLLPFEPLIIVYNKGIARLRGEINHELSSVATVINETFKRTGGGILVCSAMTPEEHLLAESGRLVEFPNNSWVKYVAHPAEEYEKYYYSFSNPFLWLLHHQMAEEIAGSPDSDPSLAYPEYLRVNRRFAGVLAEILDQVPRAKIILQDYHLYKIADALRQIRPEHISTLFLHVTFPPAEYLSKILPMELASALLEGILGNNSVGFHTVAYANNFLRACQQFLSAEVDNETGVVKYRGRTIRITVNPISINIENVQQIAMQQMTLARTQRLKNKMFGRQIISRYERIDFTKGIKEGILAYQLMLLQHPEIHSQVAMYCSFDPSRQKLAVFKKLQLGIESLIMEINRQFSPNIAWNGIIYNAEDEKAAWGQDWPVLVVDFLPQASVLALPLMSDVALVNPIIDGMNLVVKEYAALNEPGFLAQVNQQLKARFSNEAVEVQPATVIASQNMGARTEIDSGAIIIDPDDIQMTARALFLALNLSPQERAERATRMIEQVSKNTLTDWISRLLNNS